MSRGVFIWDEEKKEFVPYEKKKAAEVHSVITDEMSPTMHPMSGTVFTSKNKFREETRVRGGLEIGTEKLPDPDKRKYVDRGNRKQTLIEALKIEKENAWRRKYKRSPVDRIWRPA